ncbi:MAG: type II secretion system protein [Candidatus Paceibacterota bacterium]
MKNKGFTLIELLMVISIISLLSSVLFSYVGSVRAKARDSVRVSDMRQIGTAAKLYYEDKGDIPESIEVLVETGYLSAEPRDPKTGDKYKFYSTTTSSGKKLFTASATYENVFTTNADGEQVNQNVGVVVGDDLSITDVCILLEGMNIYPNCTVAGDSNDQVIDVTIGHRSGGVSINNEDNISDCSEDQINKTCPSNTPNGCYCGGGKYANGLIWQYPNPDIAINWYDAKTHCESVGWMLPTIDKLEEAMIDQFNNNGDNPGGFDYVGYWSKDFYNISSAWVCMNDGYTHRIDIPFDNQFMHVRCVK